MTVGEYFLGNSFRLNVDTVYRELPMTVGQLVQQFGKDACSLTVQRLYDNGTYDSEVPIVHAIEPNSYRVPDSPFSMDMPVRSVWYEKGADSDKVLRLSGHMDFPALCPRWEVLGNEAYGSGPGMDCLADVRSLQAVERKAAVMLDKGADPSMVGPPTLKNNPISMLPGGVTFVDETKDKRFRPAYEVRPEWLNAVEAKSRDFVDRVNRHLFVDLFLMISQMEGVQPRNNMEIIERKEEKMLMLGPVLENVHGELLDPMIGRIFNIALRRHLLPPIPRELADQDIEVEYTSILAQAQKAVATAGIERLFSFVGGLAAVKPDVVDKVNADKSIEEYADMLGVPAESVVPADEVEKLRAARAQQQAAANAAQMGMTAVQGAKVLSETEVGGGINALQRMVGTG
jgi:hypothetical protein